MKRIVNFMRPTKRKLLFTILVLGIICLLYLLIGDVNESNYRAAYQTAINNCKNHEHERTGGELPCFGIEFPVDDRSLPVAALISFVNLLPLSLLPLPISYILACLVAIPLSKKTKASKKRK